MSAEVRGKAERSKAVATSIKEVISNRPSIKEVIISNRPAAASINSIISNRPAAASIKEVVINNIAVATSIKVSSKGVATIYAIIKSPPSLLITIGHRLVIRGVRL